MSGDVDVFRSHEPCASRRDCYHSRAGKIGARNQSREDKARGGRNQSREDKARGGRRRIKLHGNPGTPEGSAKGGSIVGRKNVESGHLARIRELPQTKAAQREAGRENGRKNGRKNVESGHLARIRELPQTKVAQREAGRENGRKSVESGHLDRIRELPQSKAAQRENGRKVGRKNVESGQLTRIGYGIPCVTSDGILVKSVNEVTFYELALALDGEPEYEPIVIDNYTPDFVLGKSVLGLPANTPIELKPTSNWRKIRNGNSKQRIAEGVLIVYADELWY